MGPPDAVRVVAFVTAYRMIGRWLGRRAEAAVRAAVGSSGVGVETRTLTTNPLRVMPLAALVGDITWGRIDIQIPDAVRARGARKRRRDLLLNIGNRQICTVDLNPTKDAVPDFVSGIPRGVAPRQCRGRWILVAVATTRRMMTWLASVFGRSQ